MFRKKGLIVLSMYQY